MKLHVKLLNDAVTLNDFKEVAQIAIVKGETYDLYFQLTDKSKNSLRYFPSSGSTLKIDISRYTEYLATDDGVRQAVDYSVSSFATQPYSDLSIWKLPLTATQTGNMTSGAVRFTLTEGSVVKIAIVPMAIVMRNIEG